LHLPLHLPMHKPLRLTLLLIFHLSLTPILPPQPQQHQAHQRKQRVPKALEFKVHDFERVIKGQSLLRELGQHQVPLQSQA
jgi:hypothetical protein